MAELNGVVGVWMTYDYDHGPYVIALYSNAESAARGSARHGYGRIGFFPFGMELRDAVNAWEKSDG